MTDDLLQRGRKVLVGGVNSPVRSFKVVGGEPLYLLRAKGPYVYDIKGKRLVDLICGWGSIVTGHADQEIVTAACERLREGHMLGLTCELEVELAEEVIGSFKSVEKVRFTASGTECTMTALRIARAYTRRRRILVFEGCYHGHSDQLLVREIGDVGSFAGKPSSAGIPAEIVSSTIVVPFNDIELVSSALKKYKGDVAAILVEPIPANMGVVPPDEGFLKVLRELAEKEGCLLIFDEVVTGFRVARGGAQELYHVEADLTCIGKVLGGGLPIGCLGGREEIMNMLTPEGPVYHAGTFAGNPLTMALGLATLRKLNGQAYERLDELGEKVSGILAKAASRFDVDPIVQRVGSMFTIFFTRGNTVKRYSDARSSSLDSFSKFFRWVLSSGILLPPSQLEACFVTLSHSDTVGELERLLTEGEGK
ncbi:MAG: glutamate-1-semialdehyde 2,1-aminomutase [Candidatus Caldarchaeum sp.]